MDYEAIITVISTVLLGILGFVVNAAVQRRDNRIRVITQYRIDRKNATQEITANLLAYTDYHFYQSLTDEEKRKNTQAVVAEISKLRSIYFFSFPKDAELVSAAYTIKKLFCETDKDWNAINHARAHYAHLADVYVSTDWKRIKLETVGKGVRNDRFLPKWTEIFDTNEAYFSKQDMVNVNIFLEDGESEKEQ